MNENEKYPVVMTHDEVRLLIDFMLSQTPRHLVHTWIGKDRLKGEAARNAITEGIMGRFKNLQVRKGPPLPAHTVPMTHPKD